MGDNSIVSKTYNVPNNKEGHMKKKLLATVLSAVMARSMMAGCGAANTADSGVKGAAREGETKTETATAKEADPVPGTTGRQQDTRKLLITSFRSSTTSSQTSRFRLNMYLLQISRNNSPSELQQENFLIS